MITELFKGIDLPALLRFCGLGASVYLVVLLAVIVDLISGIRRSKRIGIPIDSGGLRKSIRKFNDYILFIILATFVDFLLYGFTAYELFGLRNVTYLTLITGFIAICIEAKSVWENTERNRQRDIALALKGVASLARTKGEARELLATLTEQLAEYADTPDEPSPTPSADAYTRATPNYPNPKREGREEHMHMQNEGERFEMR